MGKWKQYIPEAERAAFESRVEQKERWAKNDNDLRLAQESISKFDAYVAERGKDFDGIEDYIKTHGAVATLEDIKRAEAKAAQPAADADSADPEKSALEARVKAMEERYAASSQQALAQERETRFHAEVNPALRTALAAQGVAPEQMDVEVAKYSKVVMDMHFAEVDRIGNYDNVVPSDTVAYVMSLFKPATPAAGGTTPVQSVTPQVTVTPNENKTHDFRTGPDQALENVLKDGLAAGANKQ